MYIDNWHEFFLRHVYLAAQKSKDPKTKIGAVLVRDKNIISTGFNGFPHRVRDLPERYNDRTLKRRMVCHAEANSVLSAARLGISTLNSVLYSQGIPCSECSKVLIQGGISEIFIHSQWPNLVHSPEWVESIELSKLMLTEAEISIRVFDKVLGLKGFLDGKEIDV